ncbi:DUF2180 family protein [Streptomyces sp. TRM72054]|uniref:DUF2180 family protein n=1 Tax=Streptomyces sp. TRM72054 TaxID=2870562 RepID=UPI001C8CDFB6|nr:DUF2180 family protein [Streptomyces sp. TRM72054]MBX9399253.1 DUF2180 family protein [Streptomyces sp. TRM72054]
MWCYDCLAQDRTTTASAVCRSCGAAVCAEHVREERKEVRQLVGMGKATHDAPARNLLCEMCFHAEHTTSEPG